MSISQSNHENDSSYFQPGFMKYFSRKTKEVLSTLGSNQIHKIGDSDYWILIARSCKHLIKVDNYEEQRQRRNITTTIDFTLRLEKEIFTPTTCLDYGGILSEISVGSFKSYYQNVALSITMDKYFQGKM